MKYKRLLEIDNNPIKLLLETEKDGRVEDCRVTFYGHQGNCYFSWYDTKDAIKNLDKLIDELTKLREKL